MTAAVSTGLALALVVATAASIAAGEEARVSNATAIREWAAGFPSFDDAIGGTTETVLSADSPRRWRPSEKGSYRLVGCLQKVTPGAGARCRVLADNQRLLWERKLAADDALPHAFDILALDLTEKSTVEFRVVGGRDASRVEVRAAWQVVAEPFASRWSPRLPTGYPEFAEQRKQALREKGQRILKSIREASAAGKKRIIIPPGGYLFHANWSRASTLAGLTGLEIEARGVTFWFEPPMVHGLLFENCRDVTLRGLTIDFALPCWFQARVTEVNRQANTLRATLMPGYEPRNANGEPERSGSRALMFYDPGGGFINHRHTPAKWELIDGGAVLCKEIGRSGIPATLKPGDYVVGTIRTGAALRSKNCAGMRFEDINVFSSPGIAVWEGGGEGGNVYHRVRCTRRPHTNRLQAFGADVYHLVGADRGPVLDRCEAAYGADDTLNIHGNFGRVVQRVNDRRYYLQGVYEVGDTIEFRDQRSVDLVGIAKAVAVTPTPNGPAVPVNEKYKAKGEFLVELDKPLQLPPLSLVVMDGKQSNEGWVVRNCWFHDDFQRTLINGSPGGLMENTTLQNLGHGLCVQFETWGPWMEGPFARDFTLRYCRFLDAPPSGPCLSVSMHPPGGGSNRRRFKAQPVTNMTLAGNYFSRTEGVTLSVHNVAGLTLRGNVIEGAPAIGWEHDLGEWVYLQDCSGVVVEGR